MVSDSHKGSYILVLLLTRCQILPVLTQNVGAGVGGSLVFSFNGGNRGPGRKRDFQAVAITVKAGMGTYAQTKFFQRSLNAAGLACGVCACAMAQSLSSALISSACLLSGLWYSDYRDGPSRPQDSCLEMSSMVPDLSWGFTSFKASWLRCASGHTGLSGAWAAGASTELGFQPQLRMS